VLIDNLADCDTVSLICIAKKILNLVANDVSVLVITKLFTKYLTIKHVKLPM
jgi:hypothetical protein